MSAEDIAALQSAADVLQSYVDHLANRRSQAATIRRDGEPLATALLLATDAVLEIEIGEAQRAITYLQRKATPHD